MTVDEESSLLEETVRRLKIEYDVYFGGGSKKPPADTEWRVQSIIKKYSDAGYDHVWPCGPPSDRSLRRYRALELSSYPGGEQGRAGDCRRLHHGPEARAANAAERASAG